MKPHLFPFLFSALIVLTGCEDEDFMFNADHLINTRWGVPMIIDAGPEYIALGAPTVFRADGIVTIGTTRTDFWSLRGKRTIVLEQAGELWFIIDLSPHRLYVEKSRQIDGTFLAKCLYEPLSD